MINIHVTEQQLTVDITAPLVSDQLNYIPVHAYFDSTWANLKKTIQIRQGETLTINKKLGSVDAANFYLPHELSAGPFEIAALGEGDNVTVTTSAASLYIGKSGYNREEPADAYDAEILGYRYTVRAYDGSEATAAIPEIMQVPDAVVILPDNESVTWGMSNDELSIYGLPADTTTTVTVISKIAEKVSVD